MDERHRVAYRTRTKRTGSAHTRSSSAPPSVTRRQQRSSSLIGHRPLWDWHKRVRQVSAGQARPVSAVRGRERGGRGLTACVAVDGSVIDATLATSRDVRVAFSTMVPSPHSCQERGRHELASRTRHLQMGRTHAITGAAERTCDILRMWRRCINWRLSQRCVMGGKGHVAISTFSPAAPSSYIYISGARRRELYRYPIARVRTRWPCEHDHCALRVRRLCADGSLDDSACAKSDNVHVVISTFSTATPSSHRYQERGVTNFLRARIRTRRPCAGLVNAITGVCGALRVRRLCTCADGSLDDSACAMSDNVHVVISTFSTATLSPHPCQARGVVNFRRGCGA